MESANQPPVNSRNSTEVRRNVIEFLPDADEIERRPIHGGIPLTLYFLLSLIIIAVLWSSLSEIDKVVNARGRLVTPLPNIVVQPFETALIKSLPVRMGQIVHKGQVLATLDPTFVVADLTQIQDRLNSLDAQVRRLEAEQEGREFQARNNSDDLLQASLRRERQANYHARLLSLDESVGRLKAAITTNEREITSLEFWVKSLREIEAMNEDLFARQFQTRQSVLESRERRLGVERDLVVARNHDTELKRDLAAAEADRSAFIKEWRQKVLEELVEIRRERDSVAEQVQKAEMRNRMISLTSPEDAVILEIAKLSPGSIVREAEPLFTLVPLNVPLEAEVQVDSVDIAHVKVGDPVRIKIDAFPFQKHGTLSAKLTKLSQDSFTRQATTGEAAGSYYLGRIEFENMEFRNLKEPARLLPGMTLTAEIVVGHRSVISYFLYPMIRAFDEAAREP
jgi:HlyD family secretion protein